MKAEGRWLLSGAPTVGQLLAGCKRRFYVQRRLRWVRPLQRTDVFYGT